MEILVAALATWVKGHPVKVRWNRAQEFYNTYQRQGVVSKLKIGVKKDGTITAFELTNYWDAGAYVEYGSNVVNASGLSATGPYRIPKLRSIQYAYIRIFLRGVRTEDLCILRCCSVWSLT